MSEITQAPLLIEPHFIPSVSWWAAVAQYSEVFLDVSSHYQKGSYRNRAHVLGANGILRLSVPLEHGRTQRKTTGDVKICYDEDWQKIHWQTLISCYRRSPFFEFVEDMFAPLFIRPYTFLIDLHLAFIAVMQKLFGITTKFILTDHYIDPHDPAFNDKRNTIHPQVPSTQQFIPYTQVFSDRFPFFPNLSGIDAICNKGKVNISDLIL